MPFVVKFVQQALRSLWYGLDRLQPHQSIGKELWKEVAAADLGEMAADQEMQRAFHQKKRSYQDISRADVMIDHSSANGKSLHTNRSSEISYPTRSNEMTNTVDKYSYVDSHTVENQSCVSMIQNHVQQAVQSVADVKPLIDHSTQDTKHLPPRAQIDVMNLISNTSSNESLLGIPSSIRYEMYCQRINQKPTLHQSSSLKPLSEDGICEHAVPTLASSNDVVEHDLVVGTLSYWNKSAEGNSEMRFDATKMCRIQGCEERSMPKRPYCLQHCGNRQCEHPTCTKCAQGATRYCIAHGGGRRCTFSGCDKGARDKYFCAAHGGGKRCIAEGCNKSAVGGSDVCTSHGGGRRCSVNGCEKSAQSSTKFCVKHGGGKKCSHDGCMKVARGRTSYCASHGGGIRCKLDGCKRIAIGKFMLCRAHGGGSKNHKLRLLYESEEDSDINSSEVAPKCLNEIVK